MQLWKPAGDKGRNVSVAPLFRWCLKQGGSDASQAFALMVSPFSQCAPQGAQPKSSLLVVGNL